MQPERHIEKVLRAFARKRREQTGESFSLHAATRRLLQGEVARQHAQAQRGRQPWWRECVRFGPRLGFAAALLAILSLGFFLLYPPAKSPDQTLSFAKGKASAKIPDTLDESTAVPGNMPVAPAAVSGQERHPSTLPSPAAVAESIQPEHNPPVDALRDKDVRMLTLSATPRDAEVVNQLKPPVANEKGGATSMAISGAAAPALSDPLKTLAATARNTDSEPIYSRQATAASSGKKAASAGLPTPASPATQSARRAPASSGVELTDRRRYGLESMSPAEAIPTRSSNPPIVQQYRQQVTENGRASRDGGGVNAVLTSFQFEQQGQAIRIVDRDGSVYTGAVRTAVMPALTTVNERSETASDNPGKAKLMLKGDPQAAGLTGGLEAALPVTAFTVRGTNTTLNQILTFVGQVQSEVVTDQIGVSNQTAHYAPHVVQQNALQNSQVTGRVRLADGRELEVKARALPPNPGAK